MLQNEIIVQLEHIREMFIISGKWKALSKHILSSNDTYISLYPELLNYEKDGKEIYEIWIACNFKLDLEECHSDQMREFITSLNLKPMMIGEDYFLIKNEGKCTNYTCFFNRNHISEKIDELL